MSKNAAIIQHHLASLVASTASSGTVCGAWGMSTVNCGDEHG